MALNSLARTESSAPVPADHAAPAPALNGHPDRHPYPAYLNGYGGPFPPIAAPRAGGPSLFDTLFKLSLKRWRLLVLWTVASAAIAAVAAKTLARTVYSVEGNLIYNPEVNWKRDEYFKPPEWQTLVQLLKAPDVLEEARKDADIATSPGAFQKAVTIAPVKGTTQLMSVTVEASDPAKAAKAANRFMDLCVEKYNHMRAERLESAAGHLEEEQRKAIARRDQATASYQAALDKRNVEDPLAQRAAIERDVAAQETDVDRLRAQRTAAERELATMKKDSPEPSGSAKPADPAPEKVDESMLPPERRKDLLTERANIRQLTVSLNQKRKTLTTWIGLEQRGAIARIEVDQLRSEIKQIDEQIKGCESRIGLILETALPVAAPGFADVDPTRRGRLTKAELQRQIESLRTLIAASEENLNQKRKKLGELGVILRELRPLERERESAEMHLQKVTEDLAVVNGLRPGGKGPARSELRVWSQASIDGGAPATSNAAKLIVLVLGACMLLFLGFVAAVDLPKAVRPDSKEAELSVPVLAHLPEPGPPAPPAAEPPAVSARTPAPAPAAEPVRTLALGIGQGVTEPGSIILFTPLNERVRIESVVTELGRFYARQGEPVLVFDARADQLSRPAGKLSPARPARVDAFLEGETDDPAACFAPTQVASLEYTRGELTRRVNDGMMSMYRFRRLLDEMRQRYSRVLMIAPTACDPAEMEMLTTLSESVVLVVPESSSSDEVEPYVDGLRNVDAPLCGAVVVGSDRRGG